MQQLFFLLRLLTEDQKVTQRKREHELIIKSGMQLEECEEWIDLFKAAALHPRASIKIVDMQRLFQALELDWGKEANLQLQEWLKEVDEDNTGSIDFGEFCCLLQIMWQKDFGGIKAKSTQAIKKAQEQYLADPEAREDEDEEPTSPVGNRPSTAGNTFGRNAGFNCGTTWADHIVAHVEKHLEPTSPKTRAMIQELERVLSSKA